MFTRFHDDPLRIEKQLQQTTDIGRYIMNVPGNNGDKPLYFEDPHIRLTQWGANLRTNTVNLESDLKGMSRKLNRDCKNQNNYMDKSAISMPLVYSETPSYVQESRYSHPAFEYREVPNQRWDFPLMDPQLNICKQFENNLSTRILEKDYYKINQDFYSKN
tara:strand:- start:333 stop:815 length:483 start_codon:yes stop_codon:yes gene_type:complete